MRRLGIEHMALEDMVLIMVIYQNRITATIVSVAMSCRLRFPYFCLQNSRDGGSTGRSVGW